MWNCRDFNMGDCELSTNCEFKKEKPIMYSKVLSNQHGNGFVDDPEPKERIYPEDRKYMTDTITRHEIVDPVASDEREIWNIDDYINECAEASTIPPYDKDRYRTGLDNFNKFNSGIEMKKEHFETFAQLIRDQFWHGGEKYRLNEYKEFTDAICEAFGGESGVDFILSTCMKYLGRYKNFGREKDIIKVATYMYILWLKGGFCFNELHDDDTHSDGSRTDVKYDCTAPDTEAHMDYISKKGLSVNMKCSKAPEWMPKNRDHQYDDKC